MPIPLPSFDHLPPRVDRAFLKASKEQIRGGGDGEDGPGTFDLLGFTHHWARSRKGAWVVKRKTAKSRFTRAVRSIAVRCRCNRHRPVAEQHRVLGLKLRGHCGYYGITGNAEALARYSYELVKAWWKSLNRRSQRASMRWEVHKIGAASHKSGRSGP